MKGVIIIATKEMVTKKFGEDKWKEALKKAGVEKEPELSPVTDVDDKIALAVIKALCEVLNLSLQEVADAFGEYWIFEYSQKYYKKYYEGVNNAKDFLLKMDKVHQAATWSIKGAKPPRFEYEWKDDKTLIMKYKSHRKLIEFMIGLIKAVGKYFKEDLKVTRLSDTEVEIVFP